MKRFLQLSLLLAGISWMTATTTSCQKEYNANPADDTIKTRNPFQGGFTCYINGELFTADSKTFNDVTVEGVRTISFSAMKYNYDRDPQIYKLMTFTISPYEGTKGYPINGWGISAVYTDAQKDPSATRVYNAKVIDESSNISLTSDASNYAGTFNFEMKPVGASSDSFNLKVTDGKFDLPK